MGLIVRKAVAGVGAVALIAIGATLPAVHAAASPAPWTWKAVARFLILAPHEYSYERVFCPVGFTAITGGLEVGRFSTVYRNAEYRLDDGAGSSWFISVETPDDTTQQATLLAECVETADLPQISHDYLDFPADADGYAGGAVYCPNPGEVVLTGGYEWNNVNTRRISNNGPVTGGQAWIADGYNSHPQGAKLTVEVYCVSPNDVPGFQMIQATTTEDAWETSISCPLGKRILNGGTEGHVNGKHRQTNASYPSLTKWTATQYWAYPGSTYLRAYCIDAGTPTIELTQASPGPDGVVTNSPNALFKVTGQDPAGYPNEFKCALDGSPATYCGTSTSYENLSSGPHTFVVFNTTSDGRSSGLITYRWTVDTTAPNTSLVSGPTGQVSSTQASFAFSSEAGATFQCAIDGGAFSACTSPKAYTGLTQGQHTFSVKATDTAGNTDGSPATRTWTVDTVAPPAPSIGTHPANPTNSTSASIAFSDTEAGVGFSCSIDAGAFSTCTSPKTLSVLGDGSHTFQVRATDAAKNASSAASLTWVVDTVPPDTTIKAGPTGTVTSHRPTFRFSSSESGSSFRCSLDGATFARCTSPVTYTGVKSGAHVFKVKSRDAAGNVDGSAAVRRWKIT